MYERHCPALTRGQRRWVAKLVCAVIEAGACTQPALATALQRLRLGRATCESGQVELRRFLRDPGVTVERAYAPVVRRTLAGWAADVLLLIVDQISRKDRLTRLEVAVASHGWAVPLGWAHWPAAGIPASETWHTLFAQVLDAAHAVLPPDRPGVALLDRGCVSPAVWDAVVARGWHPVLRARRTVRLRTADGAEGSVGDRLGEQAGLVALAGAVFKKGGWRPASVTALRRDGQAEAWPLLADLPPGLQRVVAYAVRMHIEESFRDAKRHGWQWEDSRLTDPARASRRLLVLHLASLRCSSAGAAAIQAGRAARWIRPARPAWSLFRLGWTWLRHAFRHPEPVPLHHRLPHLPTRHTPLPYTLIPRHASD